ncbi:MAG: DMT family transporter [bacterium]|nr:DMT family transporter [bacterium]
MEGLIFAILSPVFSSVSTIFKGQALKYLDPFTVLAFGSFLGAIITFMIMTARGQRIDFKKIKTHKKDLILLILTRGIAADLIFTIGLSLSTGIKAVFFTKAEPYFVLLWMWILAREKIKGEYLFLLLVHIAGAILLSSGSLSFSFGVSQFGDFLILFALLLTSFSYFSAAKIVNQLGALQSNTIMLLISGVVFLPMAIFFSDKSQYSNPTGWTLLTIQAIMWNGLALTFWFASLKTVKGWIASSIRSLGPLVSAPFAYFFFRESLNNVQIIGGVIVLVTSFLIAREHLRKKH